MASYQDQSQPISDINVTPLVDVVLVLLVIFMVTAPMIAARGIAAVNSPEASTSTQITGGMVLAIDAQGRVSYSAGETEAKFQADEREKLLPLLRDHVQAFPDTKAIIAGDRDVSHGAVMEVLDLVREAGIEKFALRTAPKSSSGQSPAP